MLAALRNAYLSIGEGLRGDTVFIVPMGIQPDQVTIPDNDGAPCERVGDDITSNLRFREGRDHRHEAAYHHKRHLTRSQPIVALQASWNWRTAKG